MKVLITGATGNVGANITRHCVDRGWDVHVLVRQRSNFRGIDDLQVTRHLGDFTEPASLEPAVAGCDVVFHVGAMVTFWQKQREAAYRVNVQGTKHVIDACRRAGVRTLVYTSTVSALGWAPTPDVVMDETQPFNWPEHMVYHHSKYVAERAALEANGPGLKVVAVCPALVFGERDTYLSAGRMLVQVKQGKGIAVTAGGTALCDADDVALTHLAAAEKGRGGERYIVPATNYSLPQVFSMVAEEVGAKPPRIIIPPALARGLAPLVRLLERLPSTAPLLTGDMLYDAGTFHYVTCEKTRWELGLEPSDARVAIAKCHRWLHDRGLMPG